MTDFLKKYADIFANTPIYIIDGAYQYLCDRGNWQKKLELHNLFRVWVITVPEDSKTDIVAFQLNERKAHFNEVTQKWLIEDNWQKLSKMEFYVIRPIVQVERIDWMFAVALIAFALKHGGLKDEQIQG